MNNPIIGELEKAANIIMAPPNVVTNEQRRAAEEIFMNFRKSKSPYTLCRQILEESRVDYVLFEAAEVLKTALIREWGFLQEADILSLRQYLTHYVTNRDLASYVQDRILQTIAIIIKRGSVDDFGAERANILNDVESMIVDSNSKKQILGCSLISNLMREYASTIKSTDVGLPWETHFRAKKQFEATDLRRIFKFCVQLLSELVNTDLQQTSGNVLVLLEHLLSIAEGVLTWGFISPMLPKRLIGVYESVYEADQAPCLRLGPRWSEIMFAPQFLPLMFQIYWKVRAQDSLAHHAITCLVQLASLNGAIFSTDEMKLQYLTAYMENFLKLISSVTIRSKESLGVSNIVRKLQLFFGNDVPKLPVALQASCFDEITRLTCCFCEGAALEEAQVSDEKYYIESFDGMLEAWTNILQQYSATDEMLMNAASRIFNTFLQCHLAPPDGARNKTEEDTAEEIEDNEDNDRLRFKDQLQTIGMFGRIVPEYCLPVLFKLLEVRVEKLRVHFQGMQMQAMTMSASSALDDLFEDLHWVILIAGHVLCMDSDGETPMIPSEIMQYSIAQQTKGEATLEATLKMMASVQQIGAQTEDADRCDHCIRVMSDVLKLCALEASATEVKLGHFMSPEVGCTLMWFLKRWCLSFLMPTECFYQELSPTLIGALGKDTEGAVFVTNFVLEKIRSNVCYFHSEPVLLKDTVDLFADLVSVKQKSLHIVKSEGLWNLFNLQLKIEPGLLPQNIRRGLYKGFTLAGAALTDTQEAQAYYEQILKPVQLRFKTLLGQENFSRVYHEENVKKEIVDILECLIGVAKGSLMSIVQYLFDFMAPLLSELSVFMGLYYNYQVIVQLVLDLFGQCAKYMLCYLNQTNSRQLYESALATIRVYAKCNANRLSVEALQEESNLQDLELIMDLLTFVLSKDCLDLSPQANDDVTVTAADVSLFGLNFIMPLITIDLLKYPDLCAQYYRLIVLINDIYPEKICNLPETLLKQLLDSVKLGLSQFGSTIVQACLDFVQGMATYVYRHSMQNTGFYQALLPFLPYLLDMTLSHQINSDMISTASTCIYCLICCYHEQYKGYVQRLLQSQTDPLIAERLASAFGALMENIVLNCERQPKLRFRENFDRFIANVHGFLLTK